MNNPKHISSKRKNLPIRALGFLIPLLMVLVFAQPVFAKNTYVITDGDRVFTYTTSATDPRQVLGEAGLELDENDTYTTQAGVGGGEITVVRNQTIHINYYGEEMTASSHGETVEALLFRLNLSLDENDTISWPLNAETFDGMRLRVEHVIHQEQTYTATIPHTTSYCYDPALPNGMEVTVVEGMDGELLCTASVTYVNNQEVSRTVLEEVLIRNPVEEVIAIGTGLAAAPATDADMPIITDNLIILPSGEVLTYTESRQFRATAYTHTDPGCDMITATGTTVHIGTVAVDPRFIPYGTRMFIITNDGEYVYGISVAEDCGGAIKGDRLDLYMPTFADCIQFGFRNCTVYFLGDITETD